MGRDFEREIKVEGPIGRKQTQEMNEGVEQLGSNSPGTRSRLRGVTKGSLNDREIGGVVLFRHIAHLFAKSF